MAEADRWAPRTEIGAGWKRALLGAILAAAIGLGVAFVLSSVAVFAIAPAVGHRSLVVIVAIVFATGSLGFIATGLVFLGLRNRSLRSYLGLRVPGFGDLLFTAGGYVGALALVFGVGVLLTLFQIEAETTNQAAELGMENPELLLWFVPLSIVVIAPGEELLFRGVVQGRLREALPVRIAVPLAAAIFATVHFFALTGAAKARFVAIALLFFPSLVFGYVYERTQNLLVPILIHGAYNSTLFLALYLTVAMRADVPAALYVSSAV
ncbi:MAG: lysostaphin resistance A-like protein [Halodesulfurarchaeum sp.]